MMRLNLSIRVERRARRLFCLIRHRALPAVKIPISLRAEAPTVPVAGYLPVHARPRLFVHSGTKRSLGWRSAKLRTSAVLFAHSVASRPLRRISVVRYCLSPMLRRFDRERTVQVFQGEA